MSAAFPPPPPGPRPQNHALLGVVIGILVVLVLMLGFGVFVVSRFVRHTHIVTIGQGADQTVDVKSPLGHLHVTGDGDNSKISIDSPFGDVRVIPDPDISRFDMTVYPGATQVMSGQDSPFRDSDLAPDAFPQIHGMNFSSAPGAEVMLRGGGGSLLVNVAEFRTSASADQVLAYYQTRLGQFGAVERLWKGSTRALKVKLSGQNVRYVAVRTGRDGTHFVLVRAQAGGAAR